MFVFVGKIVGAQHYYFVSFFVFLLIAECVHQRGCTEIAGASEQDSAGGLELK